MPRKQRTSPESARLLAEILQQAKAMDPPITAAELARRTGVSQETLSRMKRHGRGDIAVIAEMAAVVGMRLKLVPIAEQTQKLMTGEFFDE